MAFTTTSNFAVKAAGFYISAALKASNSLDYLTTLENIKYKMNVQALNQTVNSVVDSTCDFTAAGTYKLDTGVSFRVEDEGIVAEVLESETEEEETEEVEAAEDDGKEADVEDWAGMEKRIQNLEDAVADLKESKEGGDDEVEASEEMAVEEPSTNPKTITTKEVVEFSAEEVEAIKGENKKLKEELAESPAEAPINTNKFSSERQTPTAQDFKRMTKQEKFLYELYK